MIKSIDKSNENQIIDESKIDENRNYPILDDVSLSNH